MVLASFAWILIFSSKDLVLHKISMAEMRMLRWISEYTRKNKIWNEEIRLEIGVVPIDEKIIESRLWCFGYVQRSVTNAPIRNSEFIQIEGM